MTDALAEPLVDRYDSDAVARALADELRTTHAVFFHQRSNRLALTTAHVVQTDADGIPLVGPGRPMTPEDEQTLLDLLMGREEAAVLEILPASVLLRERDTLMWWLPPEVRPMHLRSHQFGDRTIQTRWPNLVVLVTGRALHIAALAGTARPDAHSALFHAPLPNVYADGRMCTGNVHLPLAASIGRMAEWEAVITQSYWTHTNNPQTLRPPTVSRGRKPGKRPAAKNADADYWVTRDATDAAFEDATLMPMGITLAQWLPVLRKQQQRAV